MDAFSCGELSIDQTALAIQARPEHDDDIAVWARIMTLPQLRLAVRASKASPVEDRDDESGPSPEPEPAPSEPTVVESHEYVSLQQNEDGTWRLHGLLDSDHGAVVDAALAEARDRLYRDGNREVTWADALVDIAERSSNALCNATRGLEVHHIVHWIDGGPTDTDFLVGICRRCHRDHHLGRLGTSGHADDPNGLIFTDQYGRVLDTATHATKPDQPPPTPLHTYRHPLGEALDHSSIYFNNHRHRHAG